MVVVKRLPQFTMVGNRVSALDCREESTRQMLVACRNDLAEVGGKLATLEQVSHHIPPMRQKLVQMEQGVRKFEGSVMKTFREVERRMHQPPKTSAGPL